ncbi:hypothetical protein GUG49_15170, partial [Xanthomonas citri pv. citri]|nr:hypothetical protein [Xanthomonas citri pv. citri]
IGNLNACNNPVDILATVMGSMEFSRGMELPQQVTCCTGLQVERIADILQDAFWRPANDGKHHLCFSYFGF